MSDDEPEAAAEEGGVPAVKSVTITNAPSEHSATLASASASQGFATTKKTEKKKKKRLVPQRCAELEQWDCENDPLWRIYMKMFSEDAEKRAEAERLEQGLFGRPKCVKKPPTLVLDDEINLPVEYNAFNLPKNQCAEPADAPKASVKEDCDFEWPKLWPCTSRDVVKEQKICARKRRMKERGALPCEIDAVDSPESSDDEKLEEMAHQKELVHARIPCTQSKLKEKMLIDQASGDENGLVYGDYIKFILKDCSAEDGVSRTFAVGYLRGLVGMHLAELERVRDETWKFCLFQCLVALLAKTQLRYKYVWAPNIDYMYHHAWMMFLHIGCLNVKTTQRFDDVLVYNYKYSVELELVSEIKNIPIVKSVGFDYVEKLLRKESVRHRKELTLLNTGFNVEKEMDEYNLLVHRTSEKIENLINNLDELWTNCILRTTRFSVAFWQDGPFWYLYNPYRCGELGFWDNTGYAAISKFTSKVSLTRHIVILILRAYVYKTAHSGVVKNLTVAASKSNPEFRKRPPLKPSPSHASIKSFKKSDLFKIQIFQLLFHSCQIHNVKLYQRAPRKPKCRLVEKQKSDPCMTDPLANLSPLPCGQVLEEKLVDKMERPRWLEDFKITWTYSNQCNKQLCGKPDPTKWHHYKVVQPNRIYVLWGGLHITDRMFVEANRNQQAEACYAVYAAMTLINAPEYWTDTIVNAVVICGDRFYSERKRKFPEPNDWSAQPADRFTIGNTRFDLTCDPPATGRLFARSDQCLWRSLVRLFQSHRFAVLTCENARLGLSKHCGAYYVCDVDSYGPPIFERGFGCGYLLRVTVLEDLVRCLVLLIGSSECSDFVLRPLRIDNAVDLEDEDEAGRRGIGKCGRKSAPARKACPAEDEGKRRRRSRAPPTEKRMTTCRQPEGQRATERRCE